MNELRSVENNSEAYYNGRSIVLEVKGKKWDQKGNLVNVQGNGTKALSPRAIFAENNCIRCYIEKQCI